MAARPDYYKTLGVDRKATPEQIKKAYRKLAREYHPDRNPDDAKAEARFKEISQAHDILGDPEKRKQYDSGTGPSRRAPAQVAASAASATSTSTAPRWATSSRTSSAAAAGRRRRARAQRRPRRSAAPTSRRRSRIYLRAGDRRRAGPAAGADARDVRDLPRHRRQAGTTPSVCPQCEGRGIETQGQGRFSISQPCSRCGGSGT